MIPLANTTTQVRFNYINTPLNTVTPPSYQTQIKQLQAVRTESPIKIQQNIRTSEQKLYKLEGYSSLQLETRKNLASNKKISQNQIKGLQSIPNAESTSLLQTHQSLHKAQELDPVKQSISPKVSIPILKAQNVKSDPPKFKIQGLQEIRESEFFKNDHNEPGNHTLNSTGQQTNQSYNGNPYSNLYSRGGQTQQSESGHHHHGKRLLKQIKTFKIDKIEEKKESEFTGCCGFGITNKVAFLSKDK